MNFMNILNTITKSAASADSIDEYEIKLLREKISKLSSEGLLANNDWLLEKLNELKH